MVIAGGGDGWIDGWVRDPPTAGRQDRLPTETRLTYPRGSTLSLRLVIWSFSTTSMSFSTRSILVTTPIVRFDSGSACVNE